MKLITWILNLLIPLVVLYSIGYFVPGFSALTIGWLIFLAVLIWFGNWVVNRVLEQKTDNFGRGVISFLVSAVVIFTFTLMIEGGNVPLASSLVAAVIIALLSMIVPVVHPEKTAMEEK